MNDAEVLELLNGMIEAQYQRSLEYDDRLVEIPPGCPQIRYSEGSDQWVPRGDVLRCYLEDGKEGALFVDIDKQTLNLREFGRMLTTFAGWGMRISFVPEDRIADQPDIVVAEPDDGEP
jgi:hypothetical protein